MDQRTIPTVVTGSAAQVPAEIAAKFGMEILPLRVYVNGTEYLDGIDLTPGELYKKMRASKLEVKTAAPSIGHYYETFKKILDQGGREILCIALASRLSSDYSSAVNAANLIQKEHPDSKVMVLDSLRAAAPQGLLAIEAAQRLSSGEPLEKVFDYLTAARLRTGLIAALESLEQLSQGGRIGKAAILLGSTLRIIPILSINDEGIVAPASILRRKDRVLPTIVSILQKQTSGYQKMRVAVMHADALDQAEALRQIILEAFPSLEVPIDEFTPVMGAHAGTGLVGLGYIYE